MLDLFRGYKVTKKVRFMFGKPNESMKRKCYVFSSYKQRNNVCVIDFDRRWLLLMHFQVNMAETGRKNILAERQKRNKLPLKIFGVKVLTEW